MLIFTMDQLIVLKGVKSTQRKCVEGRGEGLGEDNKGRIGRTEGRKKNKVTTNNN